MSKNNVQTIEKIIEVGGHYGYSRTRRHPSTKSFIKETRNRSDFFNPETIAEKIDLAKTFLADLAASGKTILFIGTKPEARTVLKAAALSVRMPYVADRFIGGTLTNFPEIKKRIEKLHDLLSKKEKGEFFSRTKKERLLIDREVARMDKNFGGLSELTTLPAAVVIIDPRHDAIALSESVSCHVPVVALANSDCDISSVDYPVMANDASISTITFFLNQVTEAIISSKKTEEK